MPCCEKQEREIALATGGGINGFLQNRREGLKDGIGGVGGGGVLPRAANSLSAAEVYPATMMGAAAYWDSESGLGPWA